MQDPLSPPPSRHQIEQLLRSLTGIISATAVLDDDQRVTELHILSTHDLHPKQVVRNVESALNAGLGLEIDRRVVSVAQMEGDVDVPASQPETAAAPSDPGRLVYAGYEASRLGAQRARCAVTLERGTERFAGTGEGPDTPQGRAEAAARAVVQALANASGRDEVGLEGARVVDSEGRRYVLVSARVLDQRPGSPLSGAALLDRSPEEAAIMATLQATNRWSATYDE